MTILDANERPWSIPVLTWVHVRQVNAALRQAGDDLLLPRDKAAQPIWDWHRPEVQQWFLGWPGAPVFIAALLLADQSQLQQLDEAAFASRWRGDALDRLRDALWQEFVAYLPTDARALATQIERSITEQRANAAGKLVETFDLLIATNVLALDQTLGTARSKLLQIKADQVARGPNGTSGGSPVGSDSTPAPTA